MQSPDFHPNDALQSPSKRTETTVVDRTTTVVDRTTTVVARETDATHVTHATRLRGGRWR
jgi:hypothetical protein